MAKALPPSQMECLQTMLVSAKKFIFASYGEETVGLQQLE